jgi:hypothetical protein
VTFFYRLSETFALHKISLINANTKERERERESNDCTFICRRRNSEYLNISYKSFFFFFFFFFDITKTLN